MKNQTTEHPQSAAKQTCMPPGKDVSMIWTEPGARVEAGSHVRGGAPEVVLNQRRSMQEGAVKTADRMAENTYKRSIGWASIRIY